MKNGERKRGKKGKKDKKWSKNAEAQKLKIFLPRGIYIPSHAA